MSQDQKLNKQSTTVMDTNDRTTKALPVGGALAGSLFTAAWIIEGTLTAHYDPLRHHVSSLVLGEFGWMQVANFIISGLLLVGFAIGLWRHGAMPRSSGSVWGPLLIGPAGVGRRHMAMIPLCNRHLWCLQSRFCQRCFNIGQC